MAVLQEDIIADLRSLYQSRYSEATTRLRQVEMDWSKVVNAVDQNISSHFESLWHYFEKRWKFREEEKMHCRQHASARVRAQVLGLDVVFGQVCLDFENQGHDPSSLSAGTYHSIYYIFLVTRKTLNI